MVWWKSSYQAKLVFRIALVVCLASISSCESSKQTTTSDPTLNASVLTKAQQTKLYSPDDDTRSNEKDARIDIVRTQGTGTIVDDRELAINSVPAKVRESEEQSGDTFIYRGAPIDTVVNDILAETYGLSYIIDPNIRGEITLRLENISSRDQAISALGSALELQGFTLIQNGETYVITRAGSQRVDEDGRIVFVRDGQSLPQGTNFAVILVEKANAGLLSETIAEMGYRDIIRSSDDARNLITIAGPPKKLEDVLLLIRAFDVEWLETVSTALVPLVNSAPDELIDELESVFARTGGLEFVALNRLDAILILGANDRRIDQALEWIERLDARSLNTVSKRTLIYEARHLDAEQLLSAVQDLFTDRSSNFANSDDIFSDRGPETRVAGTDELQENRQFGSLRIVIDESRNAILARGPRAELEELADLLSRLDNPQPQILIEAMIVEVTLTDDFRLGVQWDLVEDQLRATFTDAATGSISSRFPGGSISYVDSNIQAVINALATVSDVELISSPRVTTLNNLSARLQVGDQVPVTTQSAVSVTDPDAPVVNSVSFRDTGVILQVRPSIRGGGMIEVEISQEVSAVAETTTSDIDSPTIIQRRVDSTLVVPDGSTAVLGGLISSTRSLTETGVPILKDIPGVGRLFSATGQNDRRTELVILIRPSLVNESQARPLQLSERLEAAIIRIRPELLE